MILQEIAEDWHLVWYVTAAFSLVTGISFALFAGRPVTPRRSADAPAAVTQSVELLPPWSDAAVPSAIDDIDISRPCLPLVTQDSAPPPRYVDNDITHHSSQAELSAAGPAQPVHSTHSQLISIV